MTFEKTVNAINRIMSYDVEMKKTFGKTDALKRTLILVRNHLTASENNKSVILSKEEKKVILNSIDVLLEHAITGEHTKIFKDYTFQMVKLLGNWNNAIMDSRQTTLKLQALDRIMRDARTMKDSEMILKVLINKGRDLVRYTPPLFDVSRHYKASISNKIEEKEKQAEVKR